MRRKATAGVSGLSGVLAVISANVTLKVPAEFPQIVPETGKACLNGVAIGNWQLAIGERRTTNGEVCGDFCDVSEMVVERLIGG